MNDTNDPKTAYAPESTPRDLSIIEKPAFSVQVLIFSINKDKLETVLIKRVREPFNGVWSIPGDIISLNDSLDDAAKKVLYDKTGIKDVYLEQLYTFGEVERDPRGRVITTAYFALLPHNNVDLSEAPNPLHAKWVPIDQIPPLAFDHERIIETGIARIKSKLLYSSIASGFLPEKFRLYDLQRVHEIILGKKIDKRNFRKKIQSLELIEPTGEYYKDGKHRPAQLYKFKTKELVFFN